MREKRAFRGPAQSEPGQVEARRQEEARIAPEPRGRAFIKGRPPPDGRRYTAGTLGKH